MRKAGVVGLGLASVVLALSVQAATYNDEISQMIRSGRSAKALGPDLFGDRVNGYTGALEFVQQDVSIPGNNALSVGIARRLAPGYSAHQRFGLFGDWELEIPHLQGVFSAEAGWSSGGTQRCSQFSGPGGASGVNHYSYWEQREYWRGNTFYLPGQGEGEILTRTANSLPPPTDIQTDAAHPRFEDVYPLVTKQQWAFRCINLDTTNAYYAAKGVDRGEGFVGRSPDGTVWTFNWLVRRPADTLTRSTDFPTALVANKTGTTAASTSANPAAGGGVTPNSINGAALARAEIWILPTRAQDRFGNWVTYTYDTAKPWHLKTIASSDGRSITLSYDETIDRVVKVSDGVRTWNYSYGGNRNELQSITQPDNSQLTITGGADFVAGTPGKADYGCYGPDYPVDWSSTTPSPSISFSHPSGAQGSFVYDYVTHARSYVPRECTGGDGVEIPMDARFPRFFTTKSLLTKQISGPGMTTLGWSYAYSDPNGQGSWSTCAGDCPTTKTVTVTTSDGNRKVNTYGTRQNDSEGRLQRTEEFGAAGVLLRTTAQLYRTGPERGGSIVDAGDGGNTAMRVDSVKRKDVTQQGQTFSWIADEAQFDSLDRPTVISRVGTGGVGRKETLTYSDNTAVWVLGQTESVVVADLANTPVSSAPQVLREYDSSNATLLSTSEFGVLKESFSYYTDGTLKTRADGAGNTTTFSDYKRGLAQNASYADGSSESITVNELGWITSVTVAKSPSSGPTPQGYTTSYGYDNTWGLITSVTPPAGFTATSLEFKKVDDAEFGLAGGHWRQTVTKGNAKTVTYLDGLWRPVMTRTFDATSPATENATRKVSVKAYDFNGKPSFESYPQRTADTYPATGVVDSVTITKPGTRTVYDGLGRPKHIEADSELGVLNTEIAYLDAFKTQTTNPRGFVTTQSFWALDDPNQAQLASASLPENVSLSISRDILGKPKSITRSGNGKSVTRSYVYYALGQRLCKTVEPEVGATIQNYDAAGNVEWRAPGQVSLTSTDQCDDASIATAAKIKYHYDTLNRLDTTLYGDGSPAMTRTYKADGLPATVVSNGSTWAYEYNALRQLISETFNTAGSDYVFKRDYNANGDLETLSYPDRNGSHFSVAYSPNALGEPSKVGAYASGIAYHPNGAVSDYTLGNSIVHSLSQYVRGLPKVNQDAGVLKDTYTYDQNGNVATITDGQENGLTNRSMTYDGLDRLWTANAPNVWGNATYTYDALDNLLTANVGARNTSLHYDGTNKLDKLTVNGADLDIKYDNFGNVKSKGAQGYTFDMGNRMSSATLGSNYAYDGDGRRFQATAADGKTRLTLYSQGGQLLWSESGVVGGTVPATANYTCSSGNLVNGQCEITNTYVGQATFSCTGVDALNGSSCTHTTTSTYTATWSNYSCNAGDPAPNGSTCTHTVTSNYGASLTNYSCNAGDPVPSGSTCTHTTTSTYTGAPATYSCNAGDGAPSGSTCTHITTSTYTGSVTGYSCNAGDPAPNGSTCAHTTTTAAQVNYNCPSDYTLSGSSCSKTTTTAATLGHDCGPSGIAPEVYSASPNGYACVGTVEAYSIASAAQQACQSQANSYGLSLLSVEFHKWDTSYCRMASRVVYSCPSGGSVSGSQCVSTSTQAASVSYSCSSGTVNGSQCLSTSNYTGSVNGYSCNSGDGAPNGSTCTHATSSTYTGSVTSYSCNAGDPAPNGSTCSHSSSAPYAATPNYNCNAGDPAPNGSTCTHTTSSNYAALGGAYTCPSGGSVSDNVCTVTSTNDYSASVAYSCTAGDSRNGSSCTHLSYAAPTATYTCTSGTVIGQSCIGVSPQGRTAYIYLGSKQIAEVKEGVAQYVHTDALGSPVAHTDGSGNVLNRTRYEPYGFAAAGTKPGVATAGQATTGSAVGFTGHVQDPDTDLVYMQQRYYDPIAGRFLSVDPVVTDANSGKMFDRYTYVDNNPYSRIDPDGRAPGSPNPVYACSGAGGCSSADSGGGSTPSSGPTKNDVVQSAWASSPNRYVAEAAPCVGQEGACMAANAAPLVGGGLLSNALGRYLLAAFGLASAPNSDVPVPLSRISTGRTLPNSLKEKLAMETVMAKPAGTTPPRIPPMSDTKNGLLAKDGWVKRVQNVNGVEIHYVENVNTKKVIDFKFKD